MPPHAVKREPGIGFARVRKDLDGKPISGSSFCWSKYTILFSMFGKPKIQWKK